MSSLIIPLVMLAGIPALVVIRTALRGRPRWRTSAQMRLIDRNPSLSDASLRWRTSARRMRFGRLTTALVGAAMLLATIRQRTTVVN